MPGIELLCDISEMNWIFSDSASIDGYLRKIVVMTAHHLHAAVCSVYLYDNDEGVLVLKATYGLNTALVNQVRLSLEEGLCGLALKELRPICENHAGSHPRYKYFSGLHEEHYDAFLAVPIIRGIERIGVLVVQREKGNDFTQGDIATLRVVSSQLANIIENAKELIALRKIIGNITPPEHRSAPVQLKLVKGKTASGGFVHGPSRTDARSGALETIAARADASHHGYDDFMAAVALTRKQLKMRQQAVGERLSDVASLIFTAHLLLLEDDLFFGRIVDRIRKGLSAEKAVLETARHYVGLFSALENQHLREKADDICDLSLRLFDNLVDERQAPVTHEGCIIIARDLLPSDILVYASERVAGIVLISGGASSHLAVLARSLGLPLIIADEPRLPDLPDATPLLIDGETGNVYVDPPESVLSPFRMRETARREEAAATSTVEEESFTVDRAKVTILANINLLTDVKTALDLKCEGVGLYRTEFPFIIRSDFPTEEEQFVIYRKLVAGMHGKPVTFRTMDIGGDKVLSYYDHFTEQNPFLGMRSIRFALRNMDVFRQQVRAILRAGHDADLRIMFPMITSVEELEEANAVIDSCINALRSEGAACNIAPKKGVMLEIPAVVEIIDALAERVDFFSIGTNDFVQYMLAVDRTNEKVASLYTPHHPAVLRALARISASALQHNTPVSVCGDMAHQTDYIPFLLGIGIRELSVDGMYIPRIKKFVATITLTQAKAAAAAALKETSMEKIAALLGIDG
jgi:phosphotransferase system enzyme I (PtsP)